MSTAQPEALTKGVGEFVVDESLGETGPPVTVHHIKEGGGLARHSQVVEDNGRFDDGKVVKDSVDLARGDDVAGQSVPQEVVKTIGAEERKGTLQEGINRVVVEVSRLESQVSERRGDVRTVEHLRLQALVVVLLSGGHQKIDGVRERRVGDVVQEPGNLLLEISAQTAQQDMNAQAVLEPGHVLEREGDGRRPRLTHPSKPLERRRGDQTEERRVRDRNFSINPVFPMH